ncbi:tetratricopeptide repeat-containing response regulator [Algibacillus agarilyticus]|uniref:tetratricopeptide repeat-containing response regulator n=1 Tax=Algibacillus agarilyticus TaxID=2234133 RepID=UPI0013005CBF|nr:tetratricopeptide repeat-containing response regulator [Algibacillus agarilyticus]
MILQSAFYAKKKVMVVDDCEPIRSAIKGMLQKIGFVNIQSANNGNQALQKAQEVRWDFILVDFNLGDGKDGYQLFEELKFKNYLAPHCCFFIISAENRRPHVHGLVELQPDDFLLKPFTYQGIEKRFARALAKKKVLSNVYQAIGNENTQLAITECNEIIKKTPKNALVALRVKAELLIGIKEYKKALKIYESVLEKRSVTWALMGKAIATVKLEEFFTAEAQLFELLDRPETRLEAYDWLGRLNIARNDTVTAFEMFIEAGKISPRNISRQRAIANLAIANNEVDEAVRAYSRILNNSRYSVFDTPENYLNFARCILDLCNDSNKLEVAKQIAKCTDLLKDIDKRFYAEAVQAQEHVIKARVHVIKGNMTDARQLLEESEKHDSPFDSADDRLDKAKAYFATGNLSRSDEIMESLQSVADKDDLISATLQVLIDKEKDSHEELRERIRVLNSEGLKMYQAGQYPQSVELFVEAYGYMPNNASLALNLVQAITKVGTFLTQGHSPKEMKSMCTTCVSVIEQSDLSENNMRRYHSLKPELMLLLSSKDVA